MIKITTTRISPGTTAPSARRQVPKKFKNVTKRLHTDETVPALDSRIAQCRMQPVTQDPGDRAANAFFGEPGWRTGGTLPKPLCEVVSFSAGVLRGADLSRVKRDTRCATCRVGVLGGVAGDGG